MHWTTPSRLAVVVLVGAAGCADVDSKCAKGAACDPGIGDGVGPAGDGDGGPAADDDGDPAGDPGGVTCVDGEAPPCGCPAGYDGDGTEEGTGCVDIDECGLGTHACVSGATCENSVGTYACACPEGTHGDGRVAGTGCVEDGLPPVDECALGAHACNSLATCEDLLVGYRCNCATGYAGDGRLGGTGCVDRDECAEGNTGCAEHAVCQNLVATFTCVCPYGFTGDGQASGTGCSDVDECAIDVDNCVAAATCVNDVGAFHCTCPPGYAGDGRVAGSGSGSGCVNVDECADPSLDACDDLARRCVDTEGSHACAECLPGYAENAQSQCVVDPDQCAAATHDCAAQATCTNVLDAQAPGWACTCTEACTGDGRTSGTGCACSAMSKTYVYDGPPMEIPDNLGPSVSQPPEIGCASIIVPADALAGRDAVLALRVRVGVAHARVGDLTLTLVHVDSGNIAYLFERPGYDGMNLGYESGLSAAHPLELDDAASAAAATIGQGLAADQVVCQDDGRCAFAPLQSLAAVFPGQAPAPGEWQLCGFDDHVYDFGYIVAFELELVRG